MSISKSEAIAKVNARINETDLDWPTKQKHEVIEALTEESEGAWLFFYAVVEDFYVAGRDPEPLENPPWRVDRNSGELSLEETRR
jgi:hypothetical protein